MNFYLKNAGTFVNALTLASTGAATFACNITAAGLLTVNGFGTNYFCSGGTGYNKLTIRNTTAGVANGAQLSIGTDADSDQLYIQSFATTFTTSGMNIAGGAVINGEGPGGLSIAATQSNIGFYTNGSAAGNLRMTIACASNIGFYGCATFSCTAQFSKIQKHPTGYWYKIPFSVTKNTNVGTTGTFCIVNITSDNAFNEMFIYVEYASRLQSQSDTQTQVSSRMYGINRFNSGTIAVTNSYTLVGGAGCVIDTHAPITAVAVGACTIVVKVDFSTCTSFSSFVWGEIRVYSIENLNNSLTIPYNEW
jgi:hypothetical protein